jgi:hypothetical protein
MEKGAAGATLLIREDVTAVLRLLERRREGWHKADVAHHPFVPWTVPAQGGRPQSEFTK